MGEVFIGSRAVADGTLTRHELRKWYRPIFRDVYVPKTRTVTLRDRTVGAWLSTHSQAVIAGVAASALHGANWVNPDVPIELISRHCARSADSSSAQKRSLPTTSPVSRSFR